MSSSCVSSFVPPGARPVRCISSAARSRSCTSPSMSADVGTISRVQSGAALRPLLADCGIVVLKCYADYCRSCKGIAPKYKKVAAAYADHARFLEMDFKQNEDFCRQLGVNNLPFFAIWRDGEYLGGEAIAWDKISKLTDKISKFVDEKKDG